MSCLMPVECFACWWIAEVEVACVTWSIARGTNTQRTIATMPAIAR